MFGKTIAISTALLMLMATTPSDVSAKRLLPSAKTGTSAIKSKSTASGSQFGVKASVKFKSGKTGIVATFSDLERASKVAYSLTYSSRGIQEGAGGSLTDLSGAQVRELLFATCSKNVCRYHTGLKNAKFTVTTTLKSGKKVSKTFKLKV